MTLRPASLALRLTLSIGAVITVVLLTLGWIVERSIDTHFVQQDVDELNAVVQAVEQSLLGAPSDTTTEDLKRRLAGAVSGHHNARFRLSDVSEKVLYATTDEGLGGFAQRVSTVDTISIDTVSMWEDKGQTYRGLLYN